MKVDDEVKACEQCGASVYKEHLTSGIARYEDGTLLCSHCVAEYEKSGGAVDDLAPIEFEDDDDDKGGPAVDMSSSRIHGLTDAARGKGLRDESESKRPLDPKGVGASRVRTFHCRISQGAVDFMMNQMNEWLDGHDDVTIKFATTTIGLFEGKHTEPNLIMTVFY